MLIENPYTHKHYRFKCDKCGKTWPLKYLPLSQLLESNSGWTEGLCPECQKKEEPKEEIKTKTQPKKPGVDHILSDENQEKMKLYESDNLRPGISD